LSDQFFSFYELEIHEKPLNEVVFVALDFETTGLYPAVDRVIEAGLVKFTLAGVQETFETCVNPQQLLPAEASRISGITEMDLVEAPTMNTVFPRIKEMLENCVILAHNLNFDYGFLSAEAQRLGETVSHQWGIDTVALSKTVYKGLPSYSLQNLASSLGINTFRAHRALDDARLCGELFLSCLSQIENSSEMLVEDLFRFSNTRFRK
jgi:DNA polymerase III subunit epsilon